MQTFFQRRQLLSQTNKTSPHPLYQIRDGCLGFWRQTKSGAVFTNLANFTARIEREETLDDGQSTRIHYLITGKLADGEILAPVLVPAEHFPTLQWITSTWGSRAIMAAGQGLRDHLRAAIQFQSLGCERVRAFAHLGWRKIGESWHYLHSDGAIPAPQSPLQSRNLLGGSDKVSFTTEGPVKESFLASLAILNLAPGRLSLPLLAAAYRAPLCHFLPADFSIFIYGASGCQKSELAAILQSHFGRSFNSRHLPGNWSSTANALETQAFHFKDALFIIDDFVPQGSANDINSLHATADRLLRGQGNHGGRSRLTSQADFVAQREPRGLIIATGEELPRGQSLQARLVALEVQPGEVDLSALSTAQNAAASGAFAEAMGYYLAWLANSLTRSETTESWRRRQQDLRQALNFPDAHPRRADAAAQLLLALELFLQCLVHYEAFDTTAARLLWQQSWPEIINLSSRIIHDDIDENPCTRVTRLLHTAFLSKRAHLVPCGQASPANLSLWGWSIDRLNQWRSNGNAIGWFDNGFLYLDPDAAYACVQRIAREQNEPISLRSKTLWKRLASAGISMTEDGRNLMRKQLNGQRRYVLTIPIPAMQRPEPTLPRIDLPCPALLLVKSPHGTGNSCGGSVGSPEGIVDNHRVTSCNLATVAVENSVSNGSIIPNSIQSKEIEHQAQKQRALEKISILKSELSTN